MINGKFTLRSDKMGHRVEKLSTFATGIEWISDIKPNIKDTQISHPHLNGA